MPATTPLVPLRTRRTRVLALGACLALGSLAVACGSDSSEGTEPSNKVEFCDAIGQYREAEAASDRTDMAAALRPIVSDLPEEEARQAQAYIVSLDNSATTASSTNTANEKAFLAYVDEECGEADSASDSGGSTTSTEATTTTAPDDLTPTTTAATDDGSSGTNGGTGSATNGSNSGSGGNGSTESDGSTGSSGSSDPATNGPSEGTGSGG